MKIKLFKNGASVSQEKTFPSGFHIVVLRNPAGDVVDKVKTDTYRDAMEYKRAFNAIAKGFK